MSDFASFIDIIIPVFNTQESFLDQCIESIDLADERVHVTLVDDGSDKATADYLDILASRAPSIDVWHKENGRQNSARSYGLQHSKSKYYCFLDSDDWLDWDAFLQIMSLAEENEPAILAFEFTEIEGDAIYKGKRGFSNPWNIMNARDYVVQGATLWASLFRHDVISPDKFCIGPIMGEDLATAVSIALHTGEVATTNYDAYRYRRSSESVTRKHNMRAVTDITDSIDFVKDACSHLPDENQPVVEWIAILHILYYASIRCIEWFGPRKEVKTAFFEYMQTKFPNWRNNPYLASCEIAQAPSFRLISDGKWRLYSTIRKASRR